MSSWWVWPVGAALIAAAGYAAVWVPRRRAAAAERRTAWSAARAAIDSAGVSRDACTVAVPEAEQLLSRAELVAGRRGGRTAAESVARDANRADQLWRAAGHG
jgi:hypothetical protein